MIYNSHEPGDAILFNVNSAPLALNPNFQLSEFACKDGSDYLLLHPALLLGLSFIRRLYNRAVIINSAYRTMAYNRSIGGVTGSRHVLGMAADIVVVGVLPDKVADDAEFYGFGGVGRYNSFTHIDVWGKDRRWDRRG